MQILELLVPINIVVFLVPLLIPTWKWFWISCGFIGLILGAIWAQYFYIVSQPDYSGSPGEALDLMLFLFISVAFFLGMLARFIRWLIELKIQEMKK